MVHILLDVMYAKAPYTTVQRAMHIHPTEVNIPNYADTVVTTAEMVDAL